jgi:hypothetical protein
MDKTNYEILIVLSTNECVSALKSFPQSNIQKELEVEVKPSTLNKKLKELVSTEYISYGIKDGKAYTYYITQLGQNRLQEVLG